MIDLDELERLAKAAQANSDDIGEQEWYEADEIASLMHGLIAKADAGLMARCTPPVILAFIAEMRTLREDLQATKLLAHANAEMFKAERADMESLKRQCQTLSFELLGVVIDTEQGHGFDPVCLDTIKRVRDQLHGIAGTKPCV